VKPSALLLIACVHLSAQVPTNISGAWWISLSSSTLAPGEVPGFFGSIAETGNSLSGGFSNTIGGEVVWGFSGVLSNAGALAATMTNVNGCQINLSGSIDTSAIIPGGGTYSTTACAPADSGTWYLLPSGGIIQLTPFVTGVTNAASFAKTSTGAGAPVAPGGLVSIFGYNLEPLGQVTVLARWQNASGVLQVSVAWVMNDALSGEQIDAQLPFELLGINSALGVTITVEVGSYTSAPFAIQVVPVAPGIFTTTANGLGQAILVNTANLQIATASNPIPRDGTAFFYATGLGALQPSVADGMASPASPAVATPTVLVGGITAPVLFAGQAPGYPGVNQINITIPANAPTGNDVPLQIQTADGSLTTSNLVTIAIK
jgi:uncharacterized protein (TIGR03437 family)